MSSQRDNLEALTAANRAAVEGIKAVTECQAKILQETMQALAAAMNARAKVTSPQQMITTEAEPGCVLIAPVAAPATTADFTVAHSHRESSGARPDPNVAKLTPRCDAIA